MDKHALRTWIPFRVFLLLLRNCSPFKKTFLIARLNQGGSSAKSVDTVLQNNDLLSEILLKLPSNSLFKCKCVSKKWKDMTSNHIFEDMYENKTEKASLPLLGLFHMTSSSSIPGSYSRYICFFASCKQGMAIRNRFFMKRHTCTKIFCDSSRGLILIGDDFCRDTYYVCNPITNQTLKLPIGKWDHSRVEISLSCEKISSNGVIHFKVVRAKSFFANKLEIQTFSSRTKKWSELNLCIPCQNKGWNKGQLMVNRCDVVDGVIIWGAYLYGDFRIFISIVAYDPHTTNGCIWMINFPECYNTYGLSCISRSPDGFLQCARNSPEELNIFVLSEKLIQYSCSETIDTKEWVLKHKVLYREMSFTRGNLAIYLLAIHPWDSNIVYLHVDCKIVRYNFKSGEVEISLYGCEAHSNFPYSWVPFFQPSWPYALPV